MFRLPIAFGGVLWSRLIAPFLGMRCALAHLACSNKVQSEVKLLSGLVKTYKDREGERNGKLFLISQTSQTC